MKIAVVPRPDKNAGLSAMNPPFLLVRAQPARHMTQQTVLTDENLQAVVDAWPGLSDGIRDAIILLALGRDRVG
jgi:hypothetical protein